jgi:hypothetical protein
MNKTYCNIIKKGLFVSHRGVGLCCVNPYKNPIKPSEFWHGTVRSKAVDDMSNGNTVKGCDECYANEKNNNTSMRLKYNIYNETPSRDLPTMVDLDFSNLCNLKCIMCSPGRSSELAKDRGDPNNGVRSISLDLIDDLVSISDNIQHMTIQGGEASVMKEYSYYFECLDQKNMLRNIDLQVITNATNVNMKFYRLLERFKSVRLSVSVDAFGKANNYIRWPSKFEQIEKNLIKMRELRNSVKVEIYNSLNILSMFDYHNFLTWCKKIESLYSKKDKYFGVIPLKVVDPVQWSPLVAPEKLKNKFIKDVKQLLQMHTLSHNSNFKTEMMILLNTIQKTKPNPQATILLNSSIEKLDSKRKVKITEFVPDFYQYIQKSQ